MKLETTNYQTRTEFIAQYWSVIRDDWSEIAPPCFTEKEARQLIMQYRAEYPLCERFRIVTVRTRTRIQNFGFEEDTCDLRARRRSRSLARAAR